MLETLRQKPLMLYTLLIVYALLWGVYVYAVPTFESPDEVQHVGMAHYIAETGRLPVQEAGEETIYMQQGSQPPLYYLIAAALISPIDRDDFEAVTRRNPHANVGNPGLAGNKNYVLHDQLYPAALEGTALAVFVMRAIGLLCGLVTIAAVFASARLIAPERRSVARFAAALVVFNPQFLFITASANNDNLIMALSSLTLWQVLLNLRDGFYGWRSVKIAVLVALATLTKLSGLVLVPLVALTALWVARRDRDWRGLVFLGGLMAGVWALLAGWWYARNLTLYGELFGNQRMLDVFGRREFESVGAWLRAMVSEFEGLRWSFWGVFGWFNINAPAAFYVFTDVLALLGIIGLLIYLWSQRQNRAHLVKVGFLLLALGLGLGALLTWTAQTSATQGRLLYPFMVSVAVLLALGLMRLRIPAIPVSLALAGFAVWMPINVIMPQYQPPPRDAVIPIDAAQVGARFGDVVELAAYKLPLERYAPGDDVPLTVFWRPLRQADVDYSLALHLILPDGEIAGRVDSYPGWGRLRTSTWQVGLPYRDEYRIRLRDDLDLRAPLRLLVTWWFYPDGAPLPVTGPDGSAWGNNILVNAGAVFGDAPEPTLPGMVETIPVEFGGLFRLLGYTLDGNNLSLLWETLDTPLETFAVFAQVIDVNTAQLLGQGDSRPDIPTRYYRAGERFVTRHTIIYSHGQPGQYPLQVGWYSLERPLRLSTPYPDRAYPLLYVDLPPAESAD